MPDKHELQELAVGSKKRPERDLGHIALRRSLIGNLLAVLNSATVFFAPPGSEIRPMSIPFFILLIFIFTALLAWPAAIRAILSRRQVAQGIGGLVLGLCTLPVGYFTFEAFVWFFGYTLEP